MKTIEKIRGLIGSCVQGVRMLDRRIKLALPCVSAVLLSVMLFGCSRSSDDPVQGSLVRVEGRLKVPGVLSKAVSSSPTSSQESSVSSVEILVFGSESGTFLYKISHAGLVGFSQSGDEVKFATDLPLTEGEPVDLWLLANVSDSKIASLELAEGQSKSSIASKLEYAESEGVTQVGGVTPIPMFGICGNFEVKLSGTREITAQLLRAVSKISVSAVSSDLELLEVRLYHQNRNGLVIPTGAALSSYISKLEAGAEIFVEEPSLPVDVNKAELAKDWIEAPLSGKLYAFESPAGVPLPAESYYHNPCLTVKLRLLSAGVDSYFRVDLKKGDKYVPLLRNWEYEIRINGASGGQSSHEEALLHQGIELTAEITEWATEVIEWDYN